MTLYLVTPTSGPGEYVKDAQGRLWHLCDVDDEGVLEGEYSNRPRDEGWCPAGIWANHCGFEGDRFLVLDSDGNVVDDTDDYDIFDRAESW